MVASNVFISARAKEEEESSLHVVSLFYLFLIWLWAYGFDFGVCVSFLQWHAEGLLRCGKSCRLRWINYLRTDLKRGNISAAEEDIIIKLHASLGNRLVRYSFSERKIQRNSSLFLFPSRERRDDGCHLNIGWTSCLCDPFLSFPALLLFSMSALESWLVEKVKGNLFLFFWGK